MMSEVDVMVGSTVDVDMWHKRLLHPSSKRVLASFDAVKGIKISEDTMHKFDWNAKHPCAHCERGANRPPAPKGVTKELADKMKKATHFGDLVASDTCSLPTSYPFNFVGWVVFLDWATRYLSLYFIRSHSGEEITGPPSCCTAGRTRSTSARVAPHQAPGSRTTTGSSSASRRRRCARKWRPGTPRSSSGTLSRTPLSVPISPA